MLCPALSVLAFEVSRLFVILETTVEPSSTVMPSVLALAAKRWLVFVTFLSLTVRRTGWPDRLPDWFVVRITVIGLEFELAAVGVLELGRRRVRASTALLVPMEATMEPLEATMEPLGARLGPSAARLGPSAAMSGPSAVTQSQTGTTT